MNQNNFSDIIKFAIEREIEAADFYKDMQSKVRQNFSKQILKSLEDMELNHKKLLESFSSNVSENYNPRQITNLKISDFLENV